MSVFKDRWALVTGGSSGIGFEIARLLAKEGANLALVGSDARKLSDAAALLKKEHGREPLLLPKDLAAPSAPQEIARELASRSVRVGVLVNNAGIGLYGAFDAMDPDKILRMIDVNVRSLVALTRLLAPSMKKAGSGKILNIASTAAFQAIPNEAIYAASKSFVLLFSEALREELKPHGVGVSCLCPGPTGTDFFKREAFHVSRLLQKRMMSASDVARLGVDALRQDRGVVIAGASNAFGAFLTRLAPRVWSTRIAGRVVK